MQTGHSPNQLPYEFDTLALGRKIFRYLLGFQVFVIIPGAGYSFFVSGDRGALFSLLLSGVILAGFMRIYARHHNGVRGAITKDGVIVKADGVLEFSAAKPPRRIPLSDFQSVTVEISPFSEIGHGYARVMLTGRIETAKIQIANENIEEGRSLGKALSGLLGLPYQERQTPY